MSAENFLQRSEFQIEQILDASPAKVFKAWTDPEEMARWMWAGLGTEVWAESDLRIGGAFRVCSRVAGGRHHGDGWSCMCGLYVEIIPDHRLVFTLHWDADVGYNSPERLTLDEVISVDLKPEGDATRMTVVHMGIPDDGVSANAHHEGLLKSFELLADLLAQE